ncbi:hypothetical protein SKAU_G00103070 [Synaphobranchus kaupii]|uniref:Uncharacterized protein n=1 Tax=Synaphobranchus kaupii TaxID=118154 RepID=A0A9Q1J7A9_SYNKA|nr:hypothetical protein SKAU_G00103070 [Synaphobranchus kaupii]
MHVSCLCLTRPCTRYGRIHVLCEAFLPLQTDTSPRSASKLRRYGRTVSERSTRVNSLARRSADPGAAGHAGREEAAEACERKRPATHMTKEHCAEAGVITAG